MCCGQPGQSTVSTAGAQQHHAICQADSQTAKAPDLQRKPSRPADRCFAAWSVAARQSFKEQEAMVYQQLAQLIRDAVWLKSYIAAGEQAVRFPVW